MYVNLQTVKGKYQFNDISFMKVKKSCKLYFDVHFFLLYHITASKVNRFNKVFVQAIGEVKQIVSTYCIPDCTYILRLTLQGQHTAAIPRCRHKTGEYPAGAAFMHMRTLRGVSTP